MSSQETYTSAATTSQQSNKWGLEEMRTMAMVTETAAIMEVVTVTATITTPTLMLTTAHL